MLQGRTLIPVAFRWDGEHMVPLPRFIKECNKEFAVGEVYNLETIQERSPASHASYFAYVTEVWRNLPEDLAKRFPTADKLRKWSLIKTGFANEQSMVCQTITDATRFAMLLERTNEDSVIVHKGNVIKIYTARSQSTRSMKKAEFQQSSDAVRMLLAEMIGTTTGAISSNAGQAA